MDYKDFRCNCGKCFGFCCTALCFSKSDGFPTDKLPGKPCPNLLENFQCRVHHNLDKLSLKGCIAYDCFGAGQKTAQVTYKGFDWRQNPEKAEEMFKSFLIVHQLHEMLWYLMEAAYLKPDLEKDTEKLIKEIEAVSMKDPEALLKEDIVPLRLKVNAFLKGASENGRKKFRSPKKPALKFKKTFGGVPDLSGKDLRKYDLRGENLSGACLIAANMRDMDLSGTDFIGADLRDADFSGADLSLSIFLSQIQINSARGSSDTKLPHWIKKPDNW